MKSLIIALIMMSKSCASGYTLLDLLNPFKFFNKTTTQPPKNEETEVIKDSKGNLYENEPTDAFMILGDNSESSSIEDIQSETKLGTPEEFFTCQLTMDEKQISNVVCLSNVPISCLFNEQGVVIIIDDNSETPNITKTTSYFLTYEALCNNKLIKTLLQEHQILSDVVKQFYQLRLNLENNRKKTLPHFNKLLCLKNEPENPFQEEQSKIQTFGDLINLIKKEHGDVFKQTFLTENNKYFEKTISSINNKNLFIEKLLLGINEDLQDTVKSSLIDFLNN